MKIFQIDSRGVQNGFINVENQNLYVPFTVFSSIARDKVCNQLASLCNCSTVSITEDTQNYDYINAKIHFTKPDGTILFSVMALDDDMMVYEKFDEFLTLYKLQSVGC